MQTRRRLGETADIDDGREGVQVTQVHAVAYNKFASVLE
jgi:hypothetical protein